MRMLMKVTIPVDAGNKGLKEGILPKVMDSVFEQIKPEAAFFTTDKGLRTGYVFFDMKSPSQMPSIAEPFFMKLHAQVEFNPVMNKEELQAGLETASKSF